MQHSSRRVSTRLRLRLQGHGFQSKRFRDLETASKTTWFRRVYTEPIQSLNPTMHLCQGDLVLRSLRFISWIWERPTKHEFSQAESRIVVSEKAFLFVTLQERIDEKVNISRHLCLLLRYASRFIESKIHECCKSEVKPQIKVDCAGKRCTPYEVYHIYFASQPISRHTFFKSMRFRCLHHQ